MPKTYSSDFNAAIEQIKGDTLLIVTDWASSILEGATEDINKYAVAIATDLAKLLTIPDDSRRNAVRDECLSQLKAVAELNRIKVNNATWKAFQAAMSVLASILSVAANAAAMNVPGLLNSVMSPLMASIKTK